MKTITALQIIIAKMIMGKEFLCAFPEGTESMINVIGKNDGRIAAYLSKTGTARSRLVCGLNVGHEGFEAALEELKGQKGLHLMYFREGGYVVSEKNMDYSQYAVEKLDMVKSVRELKK